MSSARVPASVVIVTNWPSSLDWKLLAGEALFGVGWALGLLCPGPALYHVAIGDPMVIFHWMPAFLVGGAVADFVKTL